MEQNMPIPGTRYFDREERQYQLMLVADHSKTNEKMAVYQALFGGFEYFTEPLGIFMTEKTEVSSEIGRTGGSKWSRPAVLQTEAANPVQDPIAKPENQKLKTEDSSVCQPVQPHHQTLEEEMANPILLEFLDAETLEEKKAEKAGDGSAYNKAEQLINEKMSESKDGTIYLNDTDIRTIIEAAQEDDAGKTTLKDQPQVGANLDLKI